MKLNNVDLNKLHVFFAVAGEGGVTGAAARLGRTRSAVSQSISSLEGVLGFRLFDRVGKRLVLTREGQHLHRRFGEYHSMLQRAMDDLVNQEGEVRGLVRLGLFLGFPLPRLADFIARFTSRHLKASIRVVYAPEEDLLARLLGNRLDYMFSFRPKSAVSPRMASVQLFEQKLVLVSGGRFFRSGFSLEELRRAPVIDYYQSDPLIDRWVAHHFGEAHAGVAVKVWAATTDLVLELILNHTGVGVLPFELAMPFVKRRRLSVIRPRKADLTDFIWLNEVRDAYRSPVLVAFREAVLDKFARRSPPGASRRRPY